MDELIRVLAPERDAIEKERRALTTAVRTRHLDANDARTNHVNQRPAFAIIVVAGCAREDVMPIAGRRVGTKRRLLRKVDRTRAHLSAAR